MNEVPLEPIRKTATARTLSAAVAERLRESILSCRLFPGSKLRLDALKELYKVGYSPLREALMKLANDGLVELEDQKGFRVAPVSEKDLTDVMTTRIMLEKVTIVDAVKLGDEQWEAGIVAAHHRLSLQSVRDGTGPVNDAWFARHAEFHYSLVSAAENDLLKRFWWVAYDRAERYRRLAVTYGSSIRDDLSEHEQLMKAALARDPDSLCHLSEAHIQKTFDIIRFDIGQRLSIF